MHSRFLCQHFLPTPLTSSKELVGIVLPAHPFRVKSVNAPVLIILIYCKHSTELIAFVDCPLYEVLRIITVV